MSVDWSPFAAVLREAVLWHDRQVSGSHTEAGAVHCMDQRLAAVRSKLEGFGVNPDDEAQLHAVVAGVMLAWEYHRTLFAKAGLGDRQAVATAGPHVLALEALARFVPGEVLTGG